jgi:hypothetical protein
MIVNVKHLCFLLFYEKVDEVGESCLHKMSNTFRKIGRKIGSTVSVLSYIVSYTSDERLVVICLYQVIILKHEQASMSLVIYYLVKEKS